MRALLESRFVSFVPFCTKFRGLYIFVSFGTNLGPGNAPIEFAVLSLPQVYEVVLGVPVLKASAQRT